MSLKLVFFCVVVCFGFVCVSSFSSVKYCESYNQYCQLSNRTLTDYYMLMYSLVDS